MDNQPKHSSIGSNLACLSLLLACAVYLCIWSSSSSLINPLFSFQKHDAQCPSKNPTTTTFNVAPDELLATLDKASIGNKTVIIAVINKAYAVQEVKADTTMLDLFIESFWQGEDTRHLLDHLVLVAVDQTAYDRCQFLRLNCYRLETDSVDFGGEKLYMSQDFIKMMWRRTWFLLEVLKRGYSFIFTDTDVLWLRNPFSRLSQNETEDLQISTDMFFGDPWNETLINTGFYHIRSNNKTIALFDRWYNMKDNATGQKEQDVLLDLIRGGIIGQLGLKVRFLDTLYFSGFCQDSKDFGAVTTVHANCCRSIVAKVKDLKAVLQDWKQFKKTTAQKTTAGLATDGFQWSGHWGCWNSWKVPNDTGKANHKA
ncbi:hypothetical protein PRUPE_2G120400 [Prunus persica]|uniref:Nucleotide-diphospho-sugar transferase domain-containing protein n=2 Tax=Prunus persica TaxID=3760 RepID=M5XRC8_PRUPE|nr:uncharacterized protein At1g28695 [Prunus persica]ONI22304.1 hypothetical protein PRUPE_2G120400 [Prunus persica]